MARLLHEGIVGPDVRELQFRLNRAVPKGAEAKRGQHFWTEDKGKPDRRVRSIEPQRQRR